MGHVHVSPEEVKPIPFRYPTGDAVLDEVLPMVIACRATSQGVISQPGKNLQMTQYERLVSRSASGAGSGRHKGRQVEGSRIPAKGASAPTGDPGRLRRTRLRTRETPRARYDAAGGRAGSWSLLPASASATPTPPAVTLRVYAHVIREASTAVADVFAKEVVESTPPARQISSGGTDTVGWLLQLRLVRPRCFAVGDRWERRTRPSRRPGRLIGCTRITLPSGEDS